MTGSRSGRTDLLAVGEPVDLSNCEREPIHVPGAVQPHGVLLGLSEPDLVVRVVSANSASLLGREPDDLLGRRVTDAVHGDLAAAIEEATNTRRDPSEHYPLSTSLRLDGDELAVDALLHRSGDLLVVEVEPGAGPLTFDTTYRATRVAVGRVNRASSPAELFAVAAEEVRRLTGFDRVMVYRFDAEWNGEVVAEDKAEHLNSFLGLRYPASDIPAQARALYRRNWLRLITDVHYVPAPLEPVLNPMTGQPLDLSHSTLRSVSPIHIEYLQNMGVSASMSISLLDRGELWGLIACHHYSGPHRPPYEVRAAAEFLGQTLSLRLVASHDQDGVRRAIDSSSRLASLTSAVAVQDRPASFALTEGATTLLDLVPASGVAVCLDDEYAALGDVPTPAAVRALVAHAGQRGMDVLALDSVPADLPQLAEHKETACGALVLRLASDQYVVWLRPEQVRTVDWGGDPHNKAIAEREGDTVRLSPRKSFERWQEVVRDRSEPWAPADLELAQALRTTLMETLYARARRLASVASTLQHSMLPERLPQLPGWTMCADYSPSAGGDVGGDWYDVVRLPSGRIACVLGDVAGHGIAAAGTMAQLRNGLRAYLMDDERPAEVLVRLGRLVAQLLPLAMATATVLVLDPATGEATVASAGHLPPCLARTDAATVLTVRPWPPLGASPVELPPPAETALRVAPGESLVLFSDGLIERRTESLDVGLDRLADVASGGDDVSALCARLMRECRDPAGDDDATVLVLGRDLPAR